LLNVRRSDRRTLAGREFRLLVLGSLPYREMQVLLILADPHITVSGTVHALTQATDTDWWGRWLLAASAVASILVAGFTAWLAYTTRKLAIETKDSVDVSQAALRLELIRDARSLAPLIVAAIESVNFADGPDDDAETVPVDELQLTNRGQGVALRIRFSATTSRGATYGAADHVQQPLAPGETKGVLLNAPPDGLNHLRIRYDDLDGNRFLTEYEHLGNRTDLPVYRRPWIAKTLGAARPEPSSEELSWPLEHFELIIGWPDSGVERGQTVEIKGKVRGDAWHRNTNDEGGR
jgi:hypothetical protein